MRQETLDHTDQITEFNHSIAKLQEENKALEDSYNNL